MRQISPMLQARIAQQQENKIQQNNNAQQIDLSQKPDTVELSTKKEENKKGKILKIAVISAAIIAAVTGGFIAAKKGLLGKSLEKHANNLWNNITSIFNKKTPTVTQKPQTPDNEPQKTVANIKKFISNGSEIEGVKLEKGKAVLANGSMFSGTMETVTKSGKKVAIDYENGLMTKSTINDKVFKTYEAPTRTLDRTKGTLIRQYDETGKKLKQSYHFYGDNGKISKSINTDINGSNVLEFSPNGTKIAEYEIDNSFVPLKGKIFREDGSIKKEIVNNHHGTLTEKTYLSDGTSTVKKGGFYTGNINEQLASKEMLYPKNIGMLNNKGELEKLYSIQEGNDLCFTIDSGRDMSNIISIRLPYSKKLGKQSEELPKAVNLWNIEKSTGKLQFVQILDDGIANGNSRSLTEGFTKDELLSTVDKLEQGIKIAEDNGMLNVVNDDSREVSYDRFRRYIQQLKDYVSKL